MNVYFRYLIATALAVVIAMPALAASSGSYSTVNSSINIGEDSRAGNVDSVNGSITIGDGSFVRSVDTVNGSIRFGNDVTVDGDVETVNGSIKLQPGCEVGGYIETVNGGVRVENTRVEGDIETVNGGLRILDRSEVSGNVVVRKPSNWSFGKQRKPVRVEIGENVVVRGDLVFEQWVELKLHESAKVGEIIGDRVDTVSGP
ncbi:MAG: hypothetical protein PVF46_07300 [Lysobacterales bacterium]|jgi:DUF4097 and DUF4098 domain-containing protein YvlB